MRGAAGIPRLALATISVASSFIPQAGQARYRQEWAAELEEMQRQGIGLAGPAVRILLGAPSVGRTLRRSRFLAAIQVEALDRAGLLSDMTRSISEQHVNILSASVTLRRGLVATKFTFEMGNPEHLRHVLKAVRTVDGVNDARRVTS